MHAYKYPAHEASVSKIARSIGFEQVSVSHEVSPLVKYVGRGDTTVIDAYLSPVLGRYVAQVSEELDVARSGARLMFMMSSGGLTAAEMFQGKDAILSGPAGGVVGLARTGEAADSAASSASTWAEPRRTSPISTASTSAPSRRRLPECGCARR